MVITVIATGFDSNGEAKSSYVFNPGDDIFGGEFTMSDASKEAVIDNSDLSELMKILDRNPNVSNKD